MYKSMVASKRHQSRHWRHTSCKAITVVHRSQNENQYNTQKMFWQNFMKIHHWVRSFSFPGSTPVRGVFFLPGRTWVIICTHSSWETKPPHTGVDPGKLNERTHVRLAQSTQFTFPICSIRRSLQLLILWFSWNKENIAISMMIIIIKMNIFYKAPYPSETMLHGATGVSTNLRSNKHPCHRIFLLSIHKLYPINCIKCLMSMSIFVVQIWYLE